MSLPGSDRRFRASAARALGFVAASPIASPILRLASRMRGGASFVVLTYHRVGGYDDPFFFGIDPEVFRHQMMLLSSRWRVLPLSELMERAEDDSLPSQAVAITFDDNYLSVHEQALPVLRELGLSATIFAPTAPLLNGGQPLWFDRVLHAYKHARRRARGAGVPGLDIGPEDSTGRRYAAALGALSWMKTLDEEARRRALDTVEEALDPAPLSVEPGHRMADWTRLHDWCAQGGQVGSHTVTHPILSRLPRERVRGELAGARLTLEEELGTPVRTLAYPNGSRCDMNRVVREEVEAAGYDHAFSTLPGINRSDWRERPYELCRIDAAETGARRLLLRLAALELAA